MWEDHLENTKALCAGSPTSFLHEDATSFRNFPTVGNLSAIANLFLFWFPFVCLVSCRGETTQSDFRFEQ